MSNYTQVPYLVGWAQTLMSNAGGGKCMKRTTDWISQNLFLHFFLSLDDVFCCHLHLQTYTFVHQIVTADW